MKRTSPFQNKESRKVISTLASIMVLMTVMVWTSPADAVRLVRVQNKVTSIKSTPLTVKPVVSRNFQKSTIRSTKPLRSLTPQRNLTRKPLKPFGKTYKKPGISKRSMLSTYGLGVDVNPGGSTGNPTNPEVNRDPASPQRVICKDRRLYPTLLKQRDCECKNNPLLSPLLRQRNCKNGEQADLS